MDWYALGWFPLALGIFIYIHAVLEYFAAGGAPVIFFTRSMHAVPGEEPQIVADAGLYRYSRNPMYLGVLLAIGAQAILWHSRTLAFYLLGSAVFFHLMIVLIEEPHLARARGDSYMEYRRRVPRWLGLPRGQRPLP